MTNLIITNNQSKNYPDPEKEEKNANMTAYFASVLLNHRRSTVFNGVTQKLAISHDELLQFSDLFYEHGGVTEQLKATWECIMNDEPTLRYFQEILVGIAGKDAVPDKTPKELLDIAKKNIVAVNKQATVNHPEN